MQKRYFGTDGVSVFLRLDFDTHPEAIKGCNAKRQKRLANMKARKFFALEYDDMPASSREQGRCSATGGSSPDDCDIVHTDVNRLLMLPNCPEFGRTSW